MPAGSGYKLAIYYRPDTGVGLDDDATLSAGQHHGQRLWSITPTVPDPGGPASWTAGSSPTVSWSVASPIPTQGEFCVWLID